MIHLSNFKALLKQFPWELKFGIVMRTVGRQLLPGQMDNPQQGNLRRQVGCTALKP